MAWDTSQQAYLEIMFPAVSEPRMVARGKPAAGGIFCRFKNLLVMIFKGEIGAAGEFLGIFNLKMWIFKQRQPVSCHLPCFFMTIAMAY